MSAAAFPHHIRPIPLELFIQAMEASHEHVVEAENEDLGDMPAGMPVADPERFKSRRWGDRMAAGMGGVMAVFPDDRQLGADCFMRLSFLMKLITKRSFRRCRHGANPDGSMNVSEAFILAVASMPLTRRQVAAWQPRQRRALKRALNREVRRRELFEAEVC